MDSAILMTVLGGHSMRSLESDWPTDARLAGAQWNLHRGVFELLIESASFDDVPLGNVAPNWDPIFTEHRLAPELIEMLERSREGLD